jgi:hypothetical protein
MIRGEGIGVFGDVRRAERGAWLFERIVATGSLVLRTVGGQGRLRRTAFSIRRG